MSSEALHQHLDDGAADAGVDSCHLCGSKISREEFLRIQERIRQEVEERSRLEIGRMTALKDREREEAVAARDFELRAQLSHEASGQRQPQSRVPATKLRNASS